MPKPLSDHDEEVVLDAERDIRSKLGGRPLDFEALLAVSNIYRAATAVRNRMERELLTPAGLSWGGFTILFVLWIWGGRETGELADDCGLAKGTLTGMLTTLERSGLVERSRHPEDGRRVNVMLLDAGLARIEGLFPRFNRLETQFTSKLSDTERKELARLLRTVTATAETPGSIAPRASSE
jgi:MarR family transcriptional regulator, organic hydroperoxide resistance regulator